MLVSLAFQLFAEVGMGDGDQRLRALGTDFPFRLTMPYSVTTYIMSERGVVTTLPGVRLRTMRLLRVAALLVGRREADEGLAAFRRIGAAHELQLAAGAADVAVAVGFRGRLALQVDLRGVVDRHHAVVLHDVVRQVGIVDRAALEIRLRSMIA